MVLISHTTFFPGRGDRLKSLTSVVIILSLSLKSPLIDKSVPPNGAILNSSISSKVNGATAVVKYLKVAVPFVKSLPVVSVGGLASVPV